MTDHTTPESMPAREKAVDQGPVSLGERLRQPQTLLSFLFAIVIVTFLVLRLDIDPADVWKHIREANLLLFGAGLVVFYCGFVLRAIRWGLMLKQAGLTPEHDVSLPATGGLLEIMLISWFVNCVVPAKLGDVYRGFLLKQRSGAPFTTTMGTIAAERIIDLVVLVVLLLGSGLVVFGRHFPSGAQKVMVYGGATVVVGLVGVAVVWIFRDFLIARMPQRFTGHLHRLQLGLFTNLQHPWRSVMFSVGIWVAEGARVYFVTWSLDSMLPGSTALFIALISSLATVSPVTPAGLGVVEALLISILPLVGVDDDVAAAVAILDRVISYASLIVVGLPLYLLYIRRGVGKAVTKEASTA